MSKWIEYRLDELLTLICNGVTATQTDEVSPFPVSRIETISEGCINRMKVRYLLKDEPRYLLQNGDILYSHINSYLHIGKVALYDDGKPLYHGMNLLALRPKKELVIPLILHTILASEYGRSHARKECKPAINQVSLGQQDIVRLAISIPPLPQQRKIAKILTTVDNLIEKTEQLIAKYQSIKQGMMHDLFARGVDAKGQLRPPQSVAPELYKQSELGWIPKEWEVDELKNRLISIDAGWSPECIERPPTTGEWGILKVSAVTKGLYLAEESKTLPTQLKPKPLIEVKPNDVLVARSNGVSELVGVTVFVDKTQERLMLSDKIMRLKVDERFLTSKYLAEIMKTSEIRKQIEQVISGSSGQKNISQEEIKSLTIKFPPVAEQRNISLILNSLKNQIQQEFNVNRIMKNLKTALMQDLLTGKVQVTPDEIDKDLAHA
jgi:restriction endonuclease S subunit